MKMHFILFIWSSADFFFHHLKYPEGRGIQYLFLTMCWHMHGDCLPYTVALSAVILALAYT